MKFYAGIGSRETPPEVLKIMTEIAAAFSNEGYTLRSGGAVGADIAFERGATEREILRAHDTDSHPEWVDHASGFHPAWDKCSNYAKKLHARNSAIILGKGLDAPVSFVVCWTKDGKATGGTGQALRIAERLSIPIFNLFNDPYGLRLSSWFRGLTNPDGSFIIQETREERNS